MRVGIGYDIHALKKGRRLVLGGITIPFSKGLLGHSDGDVLLHAIVDATLGALGAGDLGGHFSDRDPRYKNVDSLLFVEKVKKLLRRQKLKIENIDSTVIAQEPTLCAYKQRMRAKIARAFGIEAARVSVKAKTNEGFGEIGRKQAIACFAVVGLMKGS